MVKNLIEENVISVSRKYKYRDNKSDEYEIHTDSFIALLDRLISEYRIDIFLSELVDKSCSSNVLNEILDIQEKSKIYIDSLSKYSKVKSLNPKKNIHKCVIYSIKDVNLAHLIDSFINKVKARMTFDADINCIDVNDDTVDSYDDIDEAEKEQHKRKLVYSITDDYYECCDFDLSSHKIDKRILSQFERKANPISWDTVNIRTIRTFNNDDLYFLCYFYILILKSGTLWSYVELEKDYLESHNYNFQMRIKIKVYKNKNSYTFIPSCRQTNDFCRMDSYSRKKYLLTNYGIDTDYDLHSTVNVIARLLNNGQFDTSWDIKNYLEDSKLTTKSGELLTRDNGLKILTQRLFFRKSTG